MSAVSVLVIDCTTMGALLPTNTPPILTVGVFLRMIMAIAVMQFYHVNTGALSRQKHENPAKAGSRRTETKPYCRYLVMNGSLVTSLKTTVKANNTRNTNAVW